MTHDPQNPLTEAWPRLPLDEWADTLATLHRWVQIVGKTKLALTPLANHWWNVTLHLTARGLTTLGMPCGERTIEVELDFVEHRLIARSSDGATRTLALAPRTVADFYREYRAMLHALGAEIGMVPRPTESTSTLPFATDREHASYDGAAAQRAWRILSQIHRVLGVYRGRFLGKSSPVHFWWGGFDLACTRFSGRGAPLHPGGVPNTPDRVMHEAYSHECMSVGWWPGGGLSPLREPAFYAYAYPEPAGCSEAVIRPAAARYDLELREWILPYEAVRRAPDRDAAILDFAQSTYEAVATLGGWDPSLERRSG